MGAKPLVEFEEIRKSCERFYERDGFVKWADVASLYGISRQAVHARIVDAVKRGSLDQDIYEKWKSISTRRAVSRKTREAARFQERLNISITLTEETYKWLSLESKFRGVTYSDLLNGLINKQIESGK